MSLIDLLRMSSGNLKRRKLRTFLTVLGVVIGTASIVVMISLGLGLQQSTYKEIEKSGGLTTIQVTGKDRQGGMMVDSGEESKEYITDDVIEKLKKLENVYHFFFFESKSSSFTKCQKISSFLFLANLILPNQKS